MKDPGPSDLAAALDLAKDPSTSLPILTKAMRKLGIGIYTSTDQQKDERRDAYVSLRDAAVKRHPNSPACATDPWAWDDFLAAFEERNGFIYRGSGEAITSAMVGTYLETTDPCD